MSMKDRLGYFNDTTTTYKVVNRGQITQNIEWSWSLPIFNDVKRHFAITELVTKKKEAVFEDV